MYNMNSKNYSKNVFAFENGFISSMHIIQNHIICPNSKSELFFENEYVYTLNHADNIYQIYYRNEI